MLIVLHSLIQSIPFSLVFCFVVAGAFLGFFLSERPERSISRRRPYAQRFSLPFALLPFRGGPYCSAPSFSPLDLFSSCLSPWFGFVRRPGQGTHSWPFFLGFNPFFFCRWSSIREGAGVALSGPSSFPSSFYRYFPSEKLQFPPARADLRFLPCRPWSCLPLRQALFLLFCRRSLFKPPGARRRMDWPFSSHFGFAPSVFPVRPLRPTPGFAPRALLPAFLPLSP